MMRGRDTAEGATVGKTNQLNGSTRARAQSPFRINKSAGAAMLVCRQVDHQDLSCIRHEFTLSARLNHELH